MSSRMTLAHRPAEHHQALSSASSPSSPDVEPTEKKGPWSSDEDEVLRSLMNKNSTRPKWAEVACHIKGRSAKQCRERWEQNLNPKIRKDAILDAEGERIIKYVDAHGKKWAQIARDLGNRSDNAVKNWYNGMVQKSKSRRQPTGVTAFDVHFSQEHQAQLDRRNRQGRHGYSAPALGPSMLPAGPTYYNANHQYAGPYYAQETRFTLDPDQRALPPLPYVDLDNRRWNGSAPAHHSSYSHVGTLPPPEVQSQYEQYPQRAQHYFAAPAIPPQGAYLSFAASQQSPVGEGPPSLSGSRRETPDSSNSSPQTPTEPPHLRSAYSHSGCVSENVSPVDGARHSLSDLLN